MIDDVKNCGKSTVQTVKNAGKEFVSGAVDSIKDSASSTAKESISKIVTEGESLEDTLAYAGKSVTDKAVKKGSEKALNVLENDSKKAIENLKVNTNTFISKNIRDNIGGRVLSGTVSSVCDSAPSITKNSLEKLFIEGESLEDTLTYAGKSVTDKAVKDASEKVFNIFEDKSKKAIENLKVNTNTFISKNIGDNIGGRVLSGTASSVCDSAYSIMTNSLEKLFIEGESLENTLAYAGGELGETVLKKGSELLLDELKTSAKQFFKDSNNPVLKSITEQNVIGRFVTFASSIGDSVVKFVDGEITGEQFAEEILMNGMTVGISSVISVACPIPFVGPIIANLAVKTAEVIFDTRAHLDDYLIKEQMIHDIAVKAEAEMEQKRLEFQSIVQKEFDKWDSTTEEAFYQIISNSFEDNFSLDEMISGLDKILSLCGEESQFHSVGEWEEQLDMPLNLSF